MGAENTESRSQRDSAERKGYVRAHRSFNRIWKVRDSAEPDILSKILKLRRSKMVFRPLAERCSRDGKGYSPVHQAGHSDEPEGVKCVR
ncbi:hypothetical protein CE91St56_27370 [Lachnospiraceae bacterium]|nr:hypothetical protein CE91St56_27370 [Lachnospiraceae bacterium]GKH41683.1 hypothetical protein CE91St57_26570 [Lachnospiraceae bacterium]